MELQEINKVINKFKTSYVLNKYKKKNYKIVKSFIDELQNRKKILVEVLDKENQIWNTKFNLHNVLNKISTEYYEMEEDKSKKFGIGNVVSITNGDIYLQIDLIIKAIISNCRMVFVLSPVLSEFNLYVISIIQEILEAEDIEKDLISAVHSITYKKELIENKSYIDCIIINKEYDEYNYFKERVDSKVIYLDYGNVNVYVDSDEFKNRESEILNQTNNLEMDVYRYEVDDIEEFFTKETNNFIFNTVVFFSKDIKKCMRFYEIIKSNNVFINEFDVDKIKIGLEIKDLQFEKNIIIKE